MYGLHHFLPLKTISKKVTHVVKRSFLSAHGSPLAIAAPQRRLRPQVHVAVPDFRGRRGRVAHLLCFQSLRWLKARSVYDKAMVLKRECAGDSPAGLLTAQMAQSHLRGHVSCFRQNLKTRVTPFPDPPSLSGAATANGSPSK